jgi:hypothetical protein
MTEVKKIIKKTGDCKDSKEDIQLMRSDTEANDPLEIHRDRKSYQPKPNCHRNHKLNKYPSLRRHTSLPPVHKQDN